MGSAPELFAAGFAGAGSVVAAARRAAGCAGLRVACWFWVESGVMGIAWSFVPRCGEIGGAVRDGVTEITVHSRTQ